MVGNIRQEHLKVDAKIVGLLSDATYEDFPSAIRELVSNAYDADSTLVNITVDLDSDFIRIEDNGNGMSPEEFGFFLRIAGQRRGRETSPNFARPRIGQFGIGFLAVFPFGKTLNISSTVRGSDLRFEAKIPASEYIDLKAPKEVQDVSIPVTEFRDPKVREKHGVTISISPLTELARRYFLPLEESSGKRRTPSIKNLPPLERLRWNLEENLPLRFSDNAAYADAFGNLSNSEIAVTLNGEDLTRNAPGSDVLEIADWHSAAVSCRYVIATDWKSILNEERGLKIRLRNVGIGPREQFDLQTHGKTYGYLHWLTGEVHIQDGFDTLLKIDRAKFRDSPDYDEFREYFRGRLSHFANHLEHVMVAKRDIKEQLSNSRGARVGPRKQAIDKSIQRLEERGFTIVKGSPSKRSRDTVDVDLRERLITVSQGPSSMQDEITIGSTSYPVEYSIWNPFGEDKRAVRRSPDGTIEVNQQYPLFKSKRYGEMFRRILVILLLVEEEGGRNGDSQAAIAERFLLEFPDIG